MIIHHRNSFTTIHTEGAILPPDLLQRISEGGPDLGGLKPKSYHLLSGEKINEATNRSWNRLVGAWTSFQEAREHLSEDDPGTTITRERWLLPLFQELDYGRLQTSRAIDLDGKSYPISHTWGQVPIHLVGCNIDIDRRTAGVAGAARTSPHSLVQELLNRSDDYLWSFLSNGLRLRILRDNASLTRQAFVEFDLEAMFEGEVYADFVLLWLLCHQSRVEGDYPAEFWLEKWSHYAQEQGTRALDQLRDGVEDAISALGRGFLSHPANKDLRAKLRQGDLSTQDYYRQLLRMVYRLIFLFVAEDRELLFEPKSRQEARQRYTGYYSTSRLRRLAERRLGGHHADLFVGLHLVMEKLGVEAGCPELGLPSLGGFLFSEESVQDIIACQISNNDLLDAIRSLAYTVDGHALRPVDYKNLGPEEIGSVYESLLELHPEINVDARTFSLTTASGHERKTTGSYYTPSSLIQVLLDSALDPVIEDRLGTAKSKTLEEQEKALLNIKVCDPASGSGHFLIAAAHRIAKALAGVRTGDDEPSPEAIRHALRDVISHCIYGVDVNPMAVELCKVSLWMEALEPGKPLSFLDTHVKCGNSLVGVTPRMDIGEVPDDAFQPAFGDDKATASDLRKRNKREREGQLGFRWDVTLIKDEEDLRRWVVYQSQKVETMPEDQVAQVREKEAAYHALLSTDHYQHQRMEYDFWTAAFFWPIAKGDAERMLAPTQQELLRLRRGEDLDIELVRPVREISERERFFHWEFEFPTVFNRDNPGFDVVLGNPPWERIKLQEKEFFAGLDEEIAGAPNKAARQRLIDKLPDSNPILWTAFGDAKQEAENTSYFVRKSGRFPLTAIGDINTYPLFAEHAQEIISVNGWASHVLPIGIVTDDTTKGFFNEQIKNQSLRELIGFENEAFIFPAVHNEFKFCIFTITGDSIKSKTTRFVFFLRYFHQISHKERYFELSRDDIELFNPNTKTCPIFRTKFDFELTKKIYSNLNILFDEQSGKNYWTIKFATLFHMSNDSAFFLDGPREDLLPLYEAKMIWQFDHRFASLIGEGNYINRPSRKYKGWYGVNYDDPSEFVIPRYWVPESIVLDRLANTIDLDLDEDLCEPDAFQRLRSQTPKWLIGFRNVTNVVVERTTIFSVIPRAAVGHSMPLIFTTKDPFLKCCLLANFNAIVLDYCVRQKLGGVNMTYGYIKQFPIISPNRYEISDIKFIAPRILELVYTAWDLQPFAEDMSFNGPPFHWNEERRAILRAEVDAYYARLYGLSRDELRYILDPQDIRGSDFPGETFRVLKEKEMKEYSEYRTRRLVLEAWDRLAEVNFDVDAYVPMVDPPPAHPSLAHPNRDGSVYEGPGLVIETEPVDIERSRPAIKERSTGYEGQAREKTQEEKPAPKEEPPEISDYGLYKCSGCGQMVLGFDKENHIQLLHGGEEQEFVRL